MELSLRTSQRQEQRLALLPKMLQSIEVLQMTTADLLLRIQAEVDQNELLEVLSEPLEPDLPGDNGSQPDDGDDGIDVDRPRVRDAEPDRKQQFLNNVADPGASLLDYIAEQVGCLTLPDPVAAAVLVLAEHLDERGLLTLSERKLQQLVGQDLVPTALAVLQSLEPRGIGARDTVGAMLLQLPEADPDLNDIEAMLTEHLEALARNKLPEVARAMGRTMEEVQQLVERISRLNPRPAARFRNDNSRVVTPDVVVRLEGDETVIEVDDMVLPDLGIVRAYEVLAGSKQTTPDVRDYLSEKLSSARDLIDAVDQRRRTLARVTAAIMRHQREFLRRGRSALRPLRMSEIADELGLHPSTVSRAIKGKYVQTDRGILPLREFFDGNRRRLPTEGDGSGRLAIKEHVRQLVAGEDPRAPLSDDDLVRLLAEQRKVRVARRTVSKYRHELGIPSSYRRRSYLD